MDFSFLKISTMNHFALIHSLFVKSYIPKFIEFMLISDYCLLQVYPCHCEKTENDGTVQNGG